MSILTDEAIQALPKPTTSKEMVDQMNLVGAEMFERAMDDIWDNFLKRGRYSSSNLKGKSP